MSVFYWCLGIAGAIGLVVSTRNLVKSFRKNLRIERGWSEADVHDAQAKRMAKIKNPSAKVTT